MIANLKETKLFKKENVARNKGLNSLLCIFSAQYQVHDCPCQVRDEVQRELYQWNVLQ